MLLIRTLTFVGLVAACAGPATGQVVVHTVTPAEIQPRDRVPTARTGTGSIRGRVIDGLSGEPIARARVRLMMSGVTQPVVMSGSEGEFVFEKLPDGSFSIGADKATYLQGRFPDQGRTFRSSMRPRRLAAGEALDNVIVKMYRGSAISGRVLDPHGDPVEYASVNAMSVVPGGKPEARQGTQTNDLGEFRLARLQAGMYIIAVGPRRMSSDELPPGAEQEPQPVPTYYPGAVSLDQAQPVTVERGQSVSGLDVVLAEGMLVTINGVVLRRDGEPVTGAFVNARGAGRIGMMNGGGTGVRPDGTFRLSLPPGEHVLEAHASPRGNAPGVPGTQQTGIVRLSVGGSPVETVTIVVGPAATASGRVVFEGTTPPPTPPTTPLGLPLGSEDGDCRSGQARVAADWTFKVDSLLGTCQPPSRLTFGRWTLKSATRGSQDLLEKPLTFESGQHLDSIQLVFTDRKSELRFRVTDAQGQATTDYVALVFPTDKSRWDNRYGSGVEPFFLPPIDVLREMERRGAVQPPQLSAMRREAMVVAPGEYFVIAVDDIGMEEVRVPAVLERLAMSAIRVNVTDGASVEAVLRRLELSQLMR
jgi:hypothetical protein